jgi:Tol biopolymer transport system component
MPRPTPLPNPDPPGPGAGSPRPALRTRRAAPVVALVVSLAALALTACIPTGPGNEQISVDVDGVPFTRASFSSAQSLDGRYVAFASGVESFDPRGSNQIFRKDRATDEVVLVSQTDAGQQFPGRNTSVSMSADGTKIAFARVTRDQFDLNDISVVFVRDLVSNRTTMVSVATNGMESTGEAPEISSDGRYVAFSSTSPVLVAGDTNSRRDVFIRDLAALTTRRASVADSGGQVPQGADLASISGDGRHVAFRTFQNLTPDDRDSASDIYVRDMVGNRTTLASLPDNGQDVWNSVSLSDDGRFVAFLTASGPGQQQQAWVRDRASGGLTLISRRASTAQPSNNLAFDLSLSRDGQFVAFTSAASDLVAGDTNNRLDVFLAPASGGPAVLVSRTEAGAPANGASLGASVADGGTPIAFQSEATNLGEGDTNGVTDVFMNRQR